MSRRPLILAIVALVIAFLAFEHSTIDLRLQDQFYQAATRTWCVNAYAPLPRLIFYLLPKALLWLIGLTLLVLLVLPARIRRKHPRLGLFPRRQVLAALAVIGICPLAVALGKKISNVHTPAELARYGGNAPYLRVTEPIPPEARHLKRGLGFPAGHASGGFALMGLTLLVSRRRSRCWIIAGALTLGWIMGIYQMLKGVHFLSHTMISMLLCWVILEAVRVVAEKKPTVSTP
jgi:membrane-associated PAP2 superfamily phosphatase